MAITEHLRLNADEEMRIRMEQEERARLDEVFLRNYSLRKGKAEAKVEIALKMHAKGMSKQEICEITGLSVQELEKLVSSQVGQENS